MRALAFLLAETDIRGVESSGKMLGQKIATRRTEALKLSGWLEKCRGIFRAADFTAVLRGAHLRPCDLSRLVIGLPCLRSRLLHILSRQGLRLSRCSLGGCLRPQFGNGLRKDETLGLRLNRRMTRRHGRRAGGM